MLEGYSIRDEKAAYFMPPIFVKNVVMAMRSVQQAANDPQSNLNRYSKDFGLYRICDFDEESGDISHPAAPTLICSVDSLLNKPNNNEVKNG